MSLTTNPPYMISVVVPAYNAEKHLGACLESLCRQSLRNFEVIVVNDGSQDETASIAECVLSESGLPYCVLSQSNQGVSVARNSGLEIAKGEYVIFLDSDDYIHEDCLAKLSHRAETTQSDIVFCGYDYVSQDGELLRPYTERHVYLEDILTGPEALIEVFTERVSVWTGSIIFRKEHLTRYDVWFKPGRTMAQDIEFEFKALFHAGRVSSVNQSLSFYVQMPGSATRTGNFLKRLQGMDVLFALRDYFTEYVQDQEQNRFHAKQTEQLEHAEQVAQTAGIDQIVQTGQEADADVNTKHDSKYELEKQVINCLQTYRIPVSLAGVFGSLAADGCPRRKYLKLLNGRPDYIEALHKFSPVSDAKFASRRSLQVRLLRRFPSVYFVLSRIRGQLR